MIAYINGVKVEGTPEEISKYQSMNQKDYKCRKKVWCDCEDWRDMEPNRYCKKCNGNGFFYVNGGE